MKLPLKLFRNIFSMLVSEPFSRRESPQDNISKNYSPSSQSHAPHPIRYWGNRDGSEACVTRSRPGPCHAASGIPAYATNLPGPAYKGHVSRHATQKVKTSCRDALRADSDASGRIQPTSSEGRQSWHYDTPTSLRILRPDQGVSTAYSRQSHFQLRSTHN